MSTPNPPIWQTVLRIFGLDKPEPPTLSPMYAQAPGQQEWLQKLLATPFVRDTLIPVMGGNWRARAEPGAEYGPMDEGTPGTTLARVSPDAPRTVVFEQQDFNNEGLLTHELTHIVQLTGNPSGVFKLAQDIAAMTPADQAKELHGREEYAARAIASAMDAIHSGYEYSKTGWPAGRIAYDFIKSQLDQMKK